MHVIFKINKAETKFGQSVFIIGNQKCIGSWKPENALAMNTTKKEYPSWQTERYNFENNRVLQIDSKDQARNIEYKYLIKNEHGLVIWEQGPNRKIDLHSFFKKRVIDHQIVIVEDDVFDVMNKENVYTIKKDGSSKSKGVVQSSMMSKEFSMADEFNLNLIYGRDITSQKSKQSSNQWIDRKIQQNFATNNIEANLGLTMGLNQSIVSEPQGIMNQSRHYPQYNNDMMLENFSTVRSSCLDKSQVFEPQLNYLETKRTNGTKGTKGSRSQMSHSNKKYSAHRDIESEQKVKPFYHYQNAPKYREKSTNLKERIKNNRMNFDILGSDIGAGQDDTVDPNDSSRLQSFPTTTQKDKFSAQESSIPEKSPYKISNFESSNEKNKIGNQINDLRNSQMQRNQQMEIQMMNGNRYQPLNQKKISPLQYSMDLRSGRSGLETKRSNQVQLEESKGQQSHPSSSKFSDEQILSQPKSFHAPRASVQTDIRNQVLAQPKNMLHRGSVPSNIRKIPSEISAIENHKSQKYLDSSKNDIQALIDDDLNIAAVNRVSNDNPFDDIHQSAFDRNMDRGNVTIQTISSCNGTNRHHNEPNTNFNSALKPPKKVANNFNYDMDKLAATDRETEKLSEEFQFGEDPNSFQQETFDQENDRQHETGRFNDTLGDSQQRSSKRRSKRNNLLNEQLVKEQQLRELKNEELRKSIANQKALLSQHQNREKVPSVNQIEDEELKDMLTGLDSDRLLINMIPVSEVSPSRENSRYSKPKKNMNVFKSNENMAQFNEVYNSDDGKVTVNQVETPDVQKEKQSYKQNIAQSFTLDSYLKQNRQFVGSSKRKNSIVQSPREGSSKIELEYNREKSKHGSRMSGMALSEKGDAKANGIDETFGFLQDKVTEEEFVLPQLIEQENELDVTQLRIQGNLNFRNYENENKNDSSFRTNNNPNTSLTPNNKSFSRSKSKVPINTTLYRSPSNNTIQSSKISLQRDVSPKDRIGRGYLDHSLIKQKKKMETKANIIIRNGKIIKNYDKSPPSTTQNSFMKNSKSQENIGSIEVKVPPKRPQLESQRITLDFVSEIQQDQKLNNPAAKAQFPKSAKNSDVKQKIEQSKVQNPNNSFIDQHVELEKPQPNNKKSWLQMAMFSQFLDVQNKINKTSRTGRSINSSLNTSQVDEPRIQSFSKGQNQNLAEETKDINLESSVIVDIQANNDRDSEKANPVPNAKKQKQADIEKEPEIDRYEADESYAQIQVEETSSLNLNQTIKEPEQVQMIQNQHLKTKTKSFAHINEKNQNKLQQNIDHKKSDWRTPAFFNTQIESKPKETSTPEGRRENASPAPMKSTKLDENQNNILKKQSVTPKAGKSTFVIPRVPVEKALNENKEMSTDRQSRPTLGDNKKDSNVKQDFEKLQQKPLRNNNMGHFKMDFDENSYVQINDSFLNDTLNMSKQEGLASLFETEKDNNESDKGSVYSTKYNQSDEESIFSMTAIPISKLPSPKKSNLKSSPKLTKKLQSMEPMPDKKLKQSTFAAPRQSEVVQQDNHPLLKPKEVAPQLTSRKFQPKNDFNLQIDEQQSMDQININMVQIQSSRRNPLESEQSTLANEPLQQQNILTTQKTTKPFQKTEERKPVDTISQTMKSSKSTKRNLVFKGKPQMMIQLKSANGPKFSVTDKVIYEEQIENVKDLKQYLLQKLDMQKWVKNNQLKLTQSQNPKVLKEHQSLKECNLIQENVKDPVVVTYAIDIC